MTLPLKLKYIAALLALVFALSLASCGAQRPVEREFFCMDTLCVLKVYGNSGAADGCEALLTELSRAIDPYSDGAASVFNKTGESDSPDLVGLYALSDEIRKKTGGAFSPALGSVIKLWEAARDTGVLPTGNELENALGAANGRVFSENGILKKENAGTLLDFGAVGKGYAADRAAEYLKENGVASALVSFTSTVAAIGTKPGNEKWRVAVRSPDGKGNAGYIDLEDGQFLSVSGDYERKYSIGGVDYCHILDPETGRPVKNGVRSVVVIGGSGAETDALSTAVFVMGVEKGSEYCEKNGITAIIMTDEGMTFCGNAEKTFVKP